MSDVTIQGVRWISGRDIIGVVKVNDPYDGVLYYIGVAKGYSEQDDIEDIATWGTRLNIYVGELLFSVG